MLSRPDLRQLKQRIVFSEHLKAFERASIESYVQYRLVSAGHSGDKLFTRAALSLLYSASGGIPRLMNILSHKALLSAYGKGDREVRRSHMAHAVSDTDESRQWGKFLAKSNYWMWPLLGGVSALVAASVPHLLGGWS